MTGRDATARAAACLAPTALAGVLRAPTAVVGGLALIGVVVLVMAVGSDLATGDRLSRRSRWAAAVRPRPEPTPRAPRDLERMQTLVAGRSPTAVGVHQWLRPLLADLAATRLRLDHGLDLADPAAARLVPEPLWELIRPDRPEPVDRHARGVSADELAVLVDQLEAL